MNIEIKPCLNCNSDNIEMLSLTRGDTEISRRSFQIHVVEHIFHCLSCDFIKHVKFNKNNNNISIKELIETWNNINNKQLIQKEIVEEAIALENKAKELRIKAEKI